MCTTFTQETNLRKKYVLIRRQFKTMLSTLFYLKMELILKCKQIQTSFFRKVHILS